MLHRVKELAGDTIAATDGEIGRLEEIYFDDEHWGVRYLVVDTAGWLGGRKVLISPSSIDPTKSSETAISVGLSRKQVEHSPNLDTHKPVSRQYEEAFARYYGYAYYWATAHMLMPPPGPVDVKAAGDLDDAERKAAQSHLRSSAEVIGYAVEARDGAVGRLEDLLVDDETWSVADLIVDTRTWLPGRNVRVPPSAVEDIDWKDRQVRLRMRRDEIERQPAAP
jgi:sporulation protein YlmC with PRC-barrel domain